MNLQSRRAVLPLSNINPYAMVDIANDIKLEMLPSLKWVRFTTEPNYSIFDYIKALIQTSQGLKVSLEDFEAPSKRVNYYGKKHLVPQKGLTFIYGFEPMLNFPITSLEPKLLCIMYSDSEQGNINLRLGRFCQEYFFGKGKEFLVKKDDHPAARKLRDGDFPLQDFFVMKCISKESLEKKYRYSQFMSLSQLKNDLESVLRPLV